MFTSYAPKDITPDKGIEGGSCNRTACQMPHAAHCFNSVMRAFYCIKCAREINASAKRDGIEPFITIPEDYHARWEAAVMAADGAPKTA